MTTNTSSMQNFHASHNTSSGEDEPHTLASVLQRIVQNAGALMEVNNCSIALTGVTGNTVVTRSVRPNQARPTRNTRFQLNEDVAGWVAQYRIPLVINDTRLDPRFKHLEPAHAGSMICVPLIDHDEFLGTLTASSPTVNAFSARQ